MATDLVRFGVAIESELLGEFDAQLDRRGYTNRSEAIRDLIRAGLVEETVMRGGDVSGALMIVYRHHVRELSERLTEIQHDLGEKVVSSLHVHLDHDHCLEVIVLRGPAPQLKEASDRILATKGVVHGRLSLTSVGGATSKGSERPHTHAHLPSRAHSHPHEAPLGSTKKSSRASFAPSKPKRAR